MAGFRGPSAAAGGKKYAGVAGADLENAPSGPVPFTGLLGIPVTRVKAWRAGGTQPGVTSGGPPGRQIQRVSGNPASATVAEYQTKLPYGGGRWSNMRGTA